MEYTSNIEPLSGWIIPTGDIVNDLSFYNPASERLGSLFGNGRSGAMTNSNGLPATDIISPISGAAMDIAGSFGELLGQ